MAFANGSGARIACVAETGYGVTPATPTFRIMRFSGGGLASKKTTEKSEEIRADRNVVAEVLTGIDVSGQYDFELSYGTFDDLLAGALQSAWATNVLKNGVTPSFFTFEETIELGATDSFSRFTGCSVTQLSLSIEARKKITGSINLMGQKEALATAIVTGATYTAASSKPIHTASANVANLIVGSITPAPVVKSLKFEINNNGRTRPKVGSLYSDEHGSGACDVTGTIEAYFDGNPLYQAVLDHGGGALSFTVGAAANEKYTFSFPNITFLEGERKIGGNSDDVMVSIPFRACYDAATGCSIGITRAVA